MPWTAEDASCMTRNVKTLGLADLEDVDVDSFPALGVIGVPVDENTVHQ